METRDLSLWQTLAVLSDGETLRTAGGLIVYHNSGDEAGWVITWHWTTVVAQTATEATQILGERQQSRKKQR